MAAAHPPMPDAGDIPDDDAKPLIRPLNKGYRTYALTILMLLYLINFIDRQVVSILAEPIKQDLHLADWQLGMMSGLAFAILYTFLGIPIARFAERGDRPWIIATAVFVWSGFTVLCGFAQNFWHLIAARIGVGVGESGCTPPALSLISDYAPKEERASAIAFYMLGGPVGGILGMAIGGVIADLWGWRAAFMVVGAPGVVFAILTALTLAEPRRRLKAMLAAQPDAPSLSETLKGLAGRRAYWLMIGGTTLVALHAYGSNAFTASFFFRNHPEELAAMAANFGLKPAGFLGLALGVVSGIPAIFGTLIGGAWADRWARKDARALATIPAIAVLVGIPFTLTALTIPSAFIALCLLAVPAFFASMWSGPSYSAIQGLVDPRSRATATAILLFIANLIGLGGGPLLLGVISDLLATVGGLGEAQGVRWALIGFAFLSVPCAGFYWAARKTLREELVS